MLDLVTHAGRPIPDWHNLRRNILARCGQPEVEPQGPESQESEDIEIEEGPQPGEPHGSRRSANAAAYWKRLALAFRAENLELKKELQALKSGGKKGKPSQERYSSFTGGLTLGPRCNLTHVPASCMSFVLQADVHRSTTTRWELLLDAALRGSSGNFYKSCEQLLHREGGFGLQSIRSDAKNAKTWHRKKKLS